MLSRLHFGRCFHSVYCGSGTTAMAASGHEDEALANAFCTEANFNVICSMLDAAAPALLCHLNTWEELPPETVQFLAQVRGVARFLQQFADKSVSANINSLASKLPKPRRPIVLLPPEFQIPIAPVKIKTAELMEDSSDEEDTPVPHLSCIHN
ncbi:hypothetical protein C8J57DRAFT_1212437 [Mycena rebaudengoi]|nr:hypothetical protein C8J57DRAFT_1212437 [Mycena rebaudengoi]